MSKPTFKKVEKTTNMKSYHITLSTSSRGTIEFDIYTDIPNETGCINSVEAAVDNWSVRADTYTAQSLVNYINSKTGMSGHSAMTEQEYFR